MLGIDRKTARTTWTAVAILLLVLLIYTVRTTLFVFVLALLFAYLLSPLVNFLDRALPARRTRGIALALTYLIFLTTVTFVVSQIGSRVVEQGQAFGKNLPDMLKKWETPSDKISPGVNDLKTQVVEHIRESIEQGTSGLVGLLPEAGSKLMSVAGNLIFIVIVPVLAFFFLSDAEEIRSHILSFFDGPWRTRVDSLMDDLHLLLAHYMRALVMLSICTFTAYSIYFVIMGVPFGILLAVLAMCLEFIPTIGPLTAAVIIVIVTAVSGSHLAAVIIFLVAFRMLQDYMISPHLMKQGVELHPLLVLFGVFAGAEVAGVAGSFSVPILAMARTIYVHMRRSKPAVLAA